MKKLIYVFAALAILITFAPKGDVYASHKAKSKPAAKKIVKKFHWPSIDAMVKEIDFKKIMPSVESVDEMKKIYVTYPDYKQKIKKHGLFGFELE